ncbi:hypothetical protein PTTG_10311 [Puccinia triticina 1-1 BBBD Race 1]|uniref:Uncharacterized protein n=1 Tax=Puccinia triticina (isolate 1-1 / race 1 (BBBD)) TaxID=630390 RepID=A0A0C4FAR8_PUCT1|nr:hypothetical protein PTTG_10311 [Puccinia triticina 1-1 BBBD Race 1]
MSEKQASLSLASDPSAADITAKNQTSSSSNPSEPIGDGIRDWLKQILKTQHAVAVQAQEDRRAARKAEEALATRTGLLEDMMLAFGSLKTESRDRSSRANVDGIDMQKFRDVVLAKDKIKIVGNRITETNLVSFYASESATYLTGTWAAFKKRMFEVAVPFNWRMELKKQVKQLKMLPTELFLGYSTRARTLQSLVNFDTTDGSRLGDFDLAQYVVFGLQEDLQDRVNEMRYLEATPFKYGSFEQSVSASFVAIRQAQVPPLQNRSANMPAHSPTRDEIIWRIHSYLDSQGRCHFCKRTCGNVAGGCPGPVDKTWIDVPASFVTPPKSANYTAPRARGNPQQTPGRPTHPPAGRASPRAATVAGISRNLASDMIEAGLDPAAVASMLIEDERRNGPFDEEEADSMRLLGSPAAPAKTMEYEPSPAEVAVMEAIDAQVEMNEQEETLPGETILDWDDFQNEIAGI